MVFWYSLGIRRRTPYSVERIKALTDLRELINKTDKKNKNIPDWLSDTNRLIAFSIAIRVENKLHLLEELFEDKDVNTIEKL